MSTYRENLDLLSRKMGPVAPKKEFSLADVSWDKAQARAPKVDAPVVWKSGAAGGQKQDTAGGGTAAKTTTGWRAPVYTSKHQKAMDDAVAALRAVKPFEYDPESDPLFQGYKKTYTREGQRAMQDTLGQVSARTGGLASSYATSAAQQANNYYMKQLADKIPQLQEMAYRMYRDRMGDLRDDVDLYSGLEDRDRSRFESDRSFGYGVHRDDVGDQQWKKSFDQSERFHQDSKDQWQQSFDQSERFHQDSKDQWQKEFDQRALETDVANGWNVYNATGDVTRLAEALEMTPEAAQKLVDIFNQSQADKQTERDRATADWELSHGVTSKLAEMGYDTSYDQAQIDAAKRQAALKGVGSSGGGDGSYRRSSDDSGDDSAADGMDYDGLFEAAMASGHPKSFLAQKDNYKKYGFTSSSGLWDDYQAWADGGEEEDDEESGAGDWSLLSHIGEGINAAGQAVAGAVAGMGHGLVFNSLMDRAKYLTPDDSQWVALGDKIDQAYDDGDITDAEYDTLVKAMGH